MSSVSPTRTHRVHHLVGAGHGAGAAVAFFHAGIGRRVAVAHELDDFGAERLLVERDRFVATAFEGQVRLDFHGISFSLIEVSRFQRCAAASARIRWNYFVYTVHKE
jgi:hypothetical protein